VPLVFFGFAGALAFVLLGCGDGGNGFAGTAGTGGTAGSGGAGGVQTGTAMLTIVHLAPEVPSADDTRLDILVDDAVAIGALRYGESTGRVTLDAGAHRFGLAAAGATEPLISLAATLEDGDDLTLVAYRVNGFPPVRMLVFNNSTEGLPSGEGRIVLGHGGNDSLLDPIDIILTDELACPPPLLPQVAFGATAPSDGNLDLPEGTLHIGLDRAPFDCYWGGDPVTVTIVPDVVSILVLVDEDTSDQFLNPEIWAIVDASQNPLPLIGP